MAYIHPHAARWLGLEDTKLKEHYGATDQIDFTGYTKISLPWVESLHPDHRAAAQMCCDSIRKQKSKAQCFYYEINAPFHNPTHYIDITDLEAEKRKLIRFHADQQEQGKISLSQCIPRCSDDQASRLFCDLEGTLPREVPDGDMHQISYFDRVRRDLFERKTL